MENVIPPRVTLKQTLRILSVAVAAFALTPLPGNAQTNHWRFDLSANLFRAGLSGDVTTRGIPAEIDANYGNRLILAR